MSLSTPEHDDPAVPPPLFFVHVMKTGGTSLISALLETYRAFATYPDWSGGGALEEKVYPGRLLEQDPGHLRSIRFFAPHMPAWVAEAVAPDHVTATVLREPVSRTVSHLRLIARQEQFPDDIETIWADDEWRAHLADYQTQLFSEDPPDEAPEAVELTADDLPALKGALLRTMATGVGRPRVLTRDDLTAAIARLDAIDEVGVTDRLELLTERLTRRLGIDIEAPGRRNVTKEASEVPAALIESIRAHQQLDTELYEHAVRRATA